MGQVQPIVAPLVRSPTSPEEVAIFERRHGIKLPEAYAQALMSEEKCPFDSLEDWAQPEGEEMLPDDFLLQPFPHTDGWNDLSLYSENQGWNSPYFDKNLCRGSMRVTNTGCEGYVIMVVSGPCRGQLWRDLRASDMKGIFPITDSNGARVLIEAVTNEFRRLERGPLNVFSASQFFSKFGIIPQK